VCFDFYKKNIVPIYLGGILSNSTAVITDAAHMCIDATSFFISLAAIYLARKQPTQRLSFGYARAGIIKIFFLRN
jgi:Co/Zn/Cd efflux system component